MCTVIDLFCMISDIESKNMEGLAKQQRKPDSSPLLYEHCSTKSDSSHDTKQTLHDSSDESSIDSYKKTCQVSPVALHKSDNLPHVPNCSVGPSAVLRYPGDSNINANSSFVTPKKHDKHRPESRFDPETLALIREIGSAILNSPLKSELEESEETDLKEGESLVNHYVRKIEKSLQISVKRPKTHKIVIIDKEESYGDKSQSFSPVTPSSPRSESDFKTCTSKWSPVARKQTFSPTSGDKTRAAQSEKQSSSPKWCTSASSPVGVPKTISDCDDKHAADAKSPEKPTAKLHMSGEKKTANISEKQEACSVRDLRGKFELPDLGSNKITPVQSPSQNTPVSSGARSSDHSFDLGSPDSINVTLKGQNMKGQGDKVGNTQYLSTSSTPQRFSEPEIKLNPDFLKLFEVKLQEEGSSMYTRSKSVQERPDLEIELFSPEKTVRHEQSGASSSGGQSRVGQGQSRSLGYKSGPGFLQQSQSMLETDTQGPFTWEGKKVRKSYGKSHPLAKLENRNLEKTTTRKSPFYNTM